MAAPHQRLRQDPAALVWVREHLGYSQRSLAKALAISKGYMNDLESGRRSASPEMLTTLADLFGCPITVLMAKDSQQAA